ncbi:virion structural protein [Edwardsiella phage PEi20]|uniref:Small outer capsid protein n=2 Tax=Kanagawavirus pei20 TaxID=2844109 RepID=A0A0B6VLE8_9CAUD|nr:virion structural protein [Edwardsiella phage PEi20]BAQ22676.1 small outer capsid protein [Edwardsiella phage PEi20]BAQ22977.1 small outer capsid protein [Edwardsiella phage PEi26]
MGGFVNIKTFTHPAGEGFEVKGVEVSVPFGIYADAHRISGAHYQTFPSAVAAYATVVTDAADWATKNAAMFTPTAVSGGGGG